MPTTGVYTVTVELSLESVAMQVRLCSMPQPVSYAACMPFKQQQAGKREI